MPRTARKLSESGFYHVMVRGNGKQILFESDADRVFFLNRMYDCFKEQHIDLLAWCLMDNHVHLLVLDANAALPTAMAKLNGAYARRFNGSSGHVGHVFQDRYKSKPIDDENYLLEVVRYIHNNPAASKVCSTESYRWSSYREYVGVPRYVSTGLILKLIGGRDKFKQFCHEKGDPALALRCNLECDENRYLEIAKDIIAPQQLETVAGLSRNSRNACLVKLRKAGFSYKQIEHLTGIGKSTIFYAVKDSQS